MCRHIFVHDDETTTLVHTQEELANIIGRNNLVFAKGREYYGEACLCPVDLPASAAKAG